MPPWIWPSRASGFMTRPTSWVVAISTARTRPSSTSTSHTARWAAKATATIESPCPVSGSSGCVGAVAVDGGLVDRARRPAGPRAAPLGRALAQPLGHLRGTPCAPPRRSSRSGATPSVEPAEPTAVSAGSTTHALHVQLGAGDLLHARSPGPGPPRRPRVWTSASGPSAVERQAHARGGVVVEALGEGDVLEADREADAPRGCPRRGWCWRRRPGSSRRSTGLLRASGGSGMARSSSSSSRTGAGPVDHLAGGQARRRSTWRCAAAARPDPCPSSAGQPVHLRLVGERHLHRPEAAHGAAGRVVGVGHAARRCGRSARRRGRRRSVAALATTAVLLEA